MTSNLSEHCNLVELAEGELRTPVLAGDGRDVGEVVARAHEEGLSAVLEAGGDADEVRAPLSRADLEAVLTYCGEQRCADDGVTCKGCRLRAVRQGFETVDDFVAGFETITVRDSGTILPGHGQGHAAVPNLGWLMKHWSGEEYWYWARRVL